MPHTASRAAFTAFRGAQDAVSDALPSPRAHSPRSNSHFPIRSIVFGAKQGGWGRISVRSRRDWCHQTTTQKLCRIRAPRPAPGFDTGGKVHRILHAGARGTTRVPERKPAGAVSEPAFLAARATLDRFRPVLPPSPSPRLLRIPPLVDTNVVSGGATEPVGGICEKRERESVLRGREKKPRQPVMKS